MNEENQNDLNEIKLLLSSFVKEQKAFNEEQKVFNEEQKAFNKEIVLKLDRVQYFLEEWMAANMTTVLEEQELLRNEMNAKERKVQENLYDIRQDILNLKYKLA